LAQGGRISLFGAFEKQSSMTAKGSVPLKWLPAALTLTQSDSSFDSISTEASSEGAAATSAEVALNNQVEDSVDALFADDGVTIFREDNAQRQRALQLILGGESLVSLAELPQLRRP